MFIFLVWLVCTIGVSAWASRWNRSAFGWFICSFFLSPILAGLLLLISGQNGKKCSKCAEMVKIEAVKCKHCGYEPALENKQAA